jgi:hypothetical protein
MQFQKNALAASPTVVTYVTEGNAEDGEVADGDDAPEKDSEARPKRKRTPSKGGLNFGTGSFPAVHQKRLGKAASTARTHQLLL